MRNMGHTPHPLGGFQAPEQHAANGVMCYFSTPSSSKSALCLQSVPTVLILLNRLHGHETIFLPARGRWTPSAKSRFLAMKKRAGRLPSWGQGAHIEFLDRDLLCPRSLPSSLTTPVPERFSPEPCAGSLSPHCPRASRTLWCSGQRAVHRTHASTARPSQSIRQHCQSGRRIFAS
jgi:hypothetical protein